MDSIGPLDLALAASVAAAVAAAVTLFARNLRVLAGARRDATTDPLTGLGNRTQLTEDLEDELARANPDHPRVLALLDLDGFKGYNDAFGHPSGDSLLARLGRALGAAVCPWGSAYRLGGDEFCVLIRDRSPGLEILISAAAAALSDRGKGFDVRPSCGMVALPQEAGTPEAILELAERRLYAEKDGRQLAKAGADAREALKQALHERKPVRPEQLKAVPALARATGRELGLHSDELDVVVRAAELNDVGKMALPDTILSKPGPLSDEEWSYFRQHALVGDRILSAAGAMVPMAKLVRSSHEHFDGNGYPDALAGEEIPLGARIIAVCDAFHAMTSDRPYRRALSTRDACAELRRSAGNQFDPRVVDAFCEVIEPQVSAGAARPRRSSLLASAALSLVALMAPASALAGTASVTRGALIVTASAGQSSNLTLSPDGSNVRVAETGAGATLTAGTGCTSGGPNQALCPMAGLTAISVNAGDGRDRVTVTVPLGSSLQGGPDDDVLFGGPMTDVLLGEGDDDWLKGGGGADELIGGPGNDFASWMGSNAAITADLDDVSDDGELGEGDNARSDVETLVGGNAGDTLTGSGANNGLDGGPGADTLNGGAGDDYALYWWRTAAVRVDLTKNGGNGEAGENDWIGDDVESAIGGSGDDTLVGDAARNNLWSWSGNDSLDGGGSTDFLWGGSGVDLVTYASRTAPVYASLDDLANDGEAGEDDNIEDVENLTGGTAADVLTGSALANKLTGGDGEDTLIGHDGDDVFQVRDRERDDLTCGNGADSVTGDSRDAIGADCDSVDISTDAAPSEDPPVTDEGTEKKNEGATSPLLPEGGVTIERKGKLVLSLSCPTAESAGCKGMITLQLFAGQRRANASLSARKGGKRRNNVLGRARFDLDPGETARIKVKLSRNGRRRVLRRRKVRCSVNVTTIAENGERSVTQRLLTLRHRKD